MQTTRRAVRYYIDRDADTPVVRSVPVTRASAPQAVTNLSTPTHHASAESATAHASAESHRDARHRLADLVHASVRRKRRHAS
jgi:hypothetical protein